MENELKLFIDGEIKVKGGRDFTRLIGGFGDDKPSISDKQIAELLDYKKGARQVREHIERNKKHFKNEVDIQDLQRVAEKGTLTQALVSLGYAKQSITQAKNIYILSEAGFLLYLKFAEGDKAVELYKDFIEDYFKTKAENKILKATLKEQIDELKKTKATFLGLSFMEQDLNKKQELFNKSESLNNKITDLEKQLTEELTIEKYKIYKDKYKKFMDDKGCFTFEATSKILSTQADKTNIGLKIKLNKSSLPKYLRENKILSKGKSGKSYKNLPNSGYENYFNVNSKDIKIKDKSGEDQIISKTQTKVTKEGLDFLYNILTDKKMSL